MYIDYISLYYTKEITHSSLGKTVNYAFKFGSYTLEKDSSSFSIFAAILVSLGSSECVHTSPNFRITWHMGVFSVSIGSSDYVQDNISVQFPVT